MIPFQRKRHQNGIDLILAETDLENYVKDADFVITGEGRLDSQTAMGKAPSGVARIAKKIRCKSAGLCRVRYKGSRSL